jgi:DNA adenine methylase
MPEDRPISSPLKWHGGKHYLAKQIVAMMPPHVHYCEPFAGGLSVLLAKEPEGVSEVVNDLDGDLTNFWRVLADRPLFEEFRRFMEATPFSEFLWRETEEYVKAVGDCGPPSHPVLKASVFFVRCRQSMAGRMKDFATLSRNRTRRGMNEQVSAWLTAVEGLPEVHARLKRVVVLNRDALDVIRQQDGPGTLTYCDPPYMHDTRTAPAVYRHEMTADDHLRLLDVIRSAAGKVMISGYRNAAYDGALSGWHRTDFEVANNAAGGKEKRRMVESVWANFVPAGGSDAADV